MTYELIVVLLLILLNGLFAMAEIAVISLRPSRLAARARAGEGWARTALVLVEKPERFLSTVQIGITLIGVFAGAYGGMTLTEDVVEFFARWDLFGAARDDIAIVLVVSSITYLSLVLGELAPKRLALAHAEAIARVVAVPMQVLARAAAPIVWLLSASTRVVLWMMRVPPAVRAAVSEEEIRHLIGEGAAQGIIAREEQSLIDNVFRFGDRGVLEVMVPFRELDMLATDLAMSDLQQMLVEHPHAYYPVFDGLRDNITGLVSARDLAVQLLVSAPGASAAELLRAAMRPARFIPESLHAHDALLQLRTAHAGALFIVDEYGNIEGMITTTTIVRALLGASETDEDATMVQRADGSWLIDGALPVRDFLEVFPGVIEAEALQHDVVTVGGFVTARLHHIPTTGEILDEGRVRFEIVDMDGMRVDKLLVTFAAAGADLSDG
jgi:putative hemolysin